jgi:hypothetical protein
MGQPEDLLTKTCSTGAAFAELHLTNAVRQDWHRAMRVFVVGAG